MALCDDNGGNAWGGLGSYREAIGSRLDLYRDNKGMFFTLYSVDPLANHGMSFSIVFTMSIYQPNTPMVLVFVIKPASLDSRLSYALMNVNSSCSTATASRNVAGSHVYAQINALDSIAPAIWVHICREPLPDHSSMANMYSVWVDYDYTKDHMLVYADAGEGTSKPAAAVASKILNRQWMFKKSASFAFFSSMGQLLQLHTWNSTAVRRRPSFCAMRPHIPRGNQWTIALSSVLGSACAAAIMAAILVYLNSKYRRWKMEQENLIRTMQNLPGVPTQVDYAEIRKATKNFHDTMKLGKGGFGAVYRCTLPAAASRMGQQSVEVAVKKFVQEDEHRRYDDFLAEVSIINRLRHKNIVPLIGWSYNKGEPILIYEYMMNGSLDQHLFLKGGTAGQSQHQQEETSSIGTWQTRYSIAKDIATGLHYVHHEHEPMVLHRDIKASNIMVDSTFSARLGDFGIASTVAVDRSSVTGIAGTWGYIAPEYALTFRSTRQTDTYAFGVLILELVTGKKNGDVPPDDDHITDWVWRLHREERLLEAVDACMLTTEDAEDDQLRDGGVLLEAKRLLHLGLACTNPNPYNRPSMVEAVQVITKLAPPPEVPLERPTFMWPPQDWRARNSVYSTALSDCDESSTSTVETVHVSDSQEYAPSIPTGGHGSISSTVATGSQCHGSATSRS
ncbi:unnamed protein product [Miscanthus lutarioriparius]|uniref:Protein kinase domain-containing protein n=1 Tax=Miscanthus lutarioriparius TaxID=422564 RepID=A0A811M7M4_9POAL|nr:unnamed protein product [Miscanthus lutarioriparius]